MDIGEWIVVHRLLKVNGVENLDVVTMFQQGIATLDDNAAFRVIRVKIENRSVTYNFQLRSYPLSHHHASAASSCPPRCPCSLC